MKRKLNILIVEDDDLTRDVMERSLKSDLTITTDSAKNLEEAMGKIHEQSQFVVVIDPGLPDAAGGTSISRVHKEYPSVPIVVITGGGQEIVDAANEAGALTVIAKGGPDSYGENLLHRIRAALVEHDLWIMGKPMRDSLDRMDEKLQKAKDLTDSKVLTASGSAATSGT